MKFTKIEKCTFNYKGTPILLITKLEVRENRTYVKLVVDRSVHELHLFGYHYKYDHLLDTYEENVNFAFDKLATKVIDKHRWITHNIVGDKDKYVADLIEVASAHLDLVKTLLLAVML